VSRRDLTLLLALLLAVGMSAAAAVATVPYVALGPGPTIDTLGAVAGTPVIAITGRTTYPTTGHLDLTTISPQVRLTLVEAMKGWLDDEVAVVPREVLYPQDQTTEQIQQRNTETMELSQDSATTAALRELGIPIATEVVVRAVTPGAPAAGRLEPGDVLTSVDGKPVTRASELRAAIGARPPGAVVQVGYTRDGEPGRAELTTAPAGDDAARAIIGVEPGEQADYPFEVRIQLKDVGGPSAGLMFALGIIDKLDKPPLTGGAYVAGTGEISPEGVVGPIGGIAQKVLGARRKGATLFLTPAANCAEAAAARPEGLTLARVATLGEALTALRVTRSGGTPVTCSAA
jgi:PDZ domain-containing protein